MQFFELITPISYWILTVLWLIILVYYFKTLRKLKSSDTAIAIILGILFIDALRTVFESAYFGLYFNSLYGLLPKEISEVLARPELVIIPKLVNIAAALVVICLLIYRLMPKKVQEIHQAKNRLKLAASVYSSTSEGITITDTDGKIIDVNNAVVDITGYSREELVGQNPRVFKSGRHSKEFYNEMWNALKEQGSWKGEIWNKRKNGETYPEILTINSIVDSEGEVQNYVAIFSDITTIKEHQKQLEYIAHYDALTNLPNRKFLGSQLSESMAHCQRHNQYLAILFLDLDGFKTVNDTYGHKVGDELLVAVSNSMKRVLRDTDTLARIGGDEFVAIVQNLHSVSDCEKTLKRLLEASSTPFTIKGNTVQISASIGATIYPNDSADAELLIRHADHAMYQAKQKGKNCYQLFDIELAEKQKDLNKNTKRIHTAITKDEFVLYYQPKVNMRSGVVAGVEALIRWQHPDLGFLPPGEFLPLIENRPISLQVDEWVINAALKQISQWKASGLNIPVSVNISALQFQQQDFAYRLAAILAAYPDVEPHLLQLEVLETSALGDLNQVSEVMETCGVSFALDDFGTGYSSLSYLRRLPVGLIKIDQSFVRDMLNNQDDMAIVESVVGLAHSFRREVIAEGVESIEHGTALLGLGCELAQGYVIAKPMAASELPDWVNNWQPDDAWSCTVNSKCPLITHSIC